MTERNKKIINLFLEGKSIKEVSEIMDMTYSAVKHVKLLNKSLLPNSCFIQKRNVREDFFDEIDSEIKAYLLGFFLADGCIDGSTHKNGSLTNRLILQNSIDDLTIIELFNKFICNESAIYILNNQCGVKFRKPQASLRWTSSHMTNILIERYSFKRRKAYEKDFEFPFDKIPSDLIRHFIRGYFDGDGCVDFSKISTANSTQTARFNVSMVCNSYGFAKQLGDIISREMGDTSATISEIKGKTTNWFTLRFNTYRKNSLDKNYMLFKFLYENAEFFLDRKRNKFISFFEYRGKAIDNTIVHRNA